MTAVGITAVCGFLFSPPASWAAVPLPATAIVVERPWIQIKAVCPARARFEMGCAMPALGIAYVPARQAWAGAEVCRLEMRRHEEAHLKGWIHP